ncbi:unnamed protein product [Effrenium voratum]|uniref:Uncharacterized protein n=1 Tax=Effrenium voratum TaxID=2562239 RepID=A0AA36IAA9_9DINO|nr:unnamed protein product [Effrenium voratum]
MGRGKTPPGAGVGFALAELRAARANMNTKRAAGALPLGSKAEMETSWQEEVQAALLREKLLQEKLDALEAKDAGSMPPSRRNSSKSSCPGTPAGEQEKWKQEKTMLTMEVARLERLVEDEKELASQKEKMQQEKSARLEEALKDLEQKMLERTKAEGSELETRLAEAEAKASAKEREVADLQSSVQALSNESDQLRRDLAESRAQLEETHKAKTDLAVLSEDQRCQLESMQEEMESSQSKARVLEKLKEDAETKLMEHELKVQDLEAKLQDAEAAAMAKVPVEPVVREVVREVQRDSAGEELHREVRLAKARVAELEAQHADQLASMELRQETLAAQVTMLQQQLDLARRDRKTRMAGLLNSRRTAGAPEQTDAAQPPAAPSAGGTTQTFNTPAVGASSLFAQPSTTKDASALFGPGPTVPPAQVAEQTDAVASSAPAAASARGTADPFQPPAAVDTSSWFDEEPSTTKDASALFGPGPTVPPAQAAEQTDAVASSATAAASMGGTTQTFNTPAVGASSLFAQPSTTKDASALFGPGPTVPPAQVAEQTDAVASSAPAAASARGTTDPFKPPAAVDTSSCFDEGPSTTTQDASALFGPGPTVPPAQAAEQTDAVASSAPVTSQATGGVTDPFKPPAAVDTSSWFNQGTATQDTSGLFDEGPSTTQDASGLFDEGPGTTQDASGLFGAGPTTPPVQAEQTDVASSAPVAATAAGVTDPFKPPAAVDTSSWFNQGTATQDTSGLFDEGPSTTQDASGLFDEGPGTTQDASGLFGAGPTTPPVQAEQTDVASSAPAAATAAGVTDPFKPPAAVDTSSWFNQGTATQDTSGFFDEGPSTTHDASGLFDEGPGTTQDASGLFGAGPTTPPVQAEQTDVASSAPAAATAAGVTDPFKPPAAVDTSSWFNQGTATQDTSGFFDEGPSTTHDASGLFDEGPGTTQDASGLFGAGPTTPPVQAEQTDVASSAPAAATAAGVTDPFKPPAAVDTSSWFNQGTATQDTSGFFDEGPSTTHDASGLFDEGPGTTQDASGLFGAGPTTPPVQAEQTDVASSAPQPRIRPAGLTRGPARLWMLPVSLTRGPAQRHRMRLVSLDPAQRCLQHKPRSRQTARPALPQQRQLHKVWRTPSSRQPPWTRPAGLTRARRRRTLLGSLTRAPAQLRMLPVSLTRGPARRHRMRLVSLDPVQRRLQHKPSRQTAHSALLQHQPLQEARRIPSRRQLWTRPAGLTRGPALLRMLPVSLGQQMHRKWTRRVQGYSRQWQHQALPPSQLRWIHPAGSMMLGPALCLEHRPCPMGRDPSDRQVLAIPMTSLGAVQRPEEAPVPMTSPPCSESLGDSAIRRCGLPR